MPWHNRFEDRLQGRFKDAQAAGAELRRRASLLADEHLARWRRDECAARNWYAEALRERREEECWRARIGMDVTRSRRAVAPSDFTARVMGRIEAEPELLDPMTAAMVEGALSLRTLARALAGSVGLATVVALASGCLLAVLAPAQTLGLLTALLRAGVVLATVLRAAMGLRGGELISPTFLLLLGALPVFVLATLGRARSRLARSR